MGILGALRNLLHVKTGEYVDNRPLSPVLSSFPMQIRRPLQNCDFAAVPGFSYLGNSYYNSWMALPSR